MRGRLILTAALLTLGMSALVLAGCGDDGGEDPDRPLRLDGEETVLALAAKTARALKREGIEVDAVDPSSVGFEGIEFPIVGGQIDAEASAGTIDHAGGIRLSSDGTRLKLTDFIVDLKLGTLTATTPDGPGLRTLSLDSGGIERTEGDGEIVLDGILATLSGAAAEALNDAFDTSVFSRDLDMGQITVTATAG